MPRKVYMTVRQSVKVIGHERQKLQAVIDKAAVAGAILDDPKEAKATFWRMLKEYFARDDF